MSTRTRLLTLLALSALGACATTDYGSRMYPIALTTVPPQCQGWIVPNTKWVVEKETIAREGSAALGSYQSIRTPWSGRMLPYVFVFVAVDAAQQLRWTEFTPSRDTQVVIDFGPVSAASPGAN